jgi:peptidoglycan/xylan/chitin deacetylase (PgdA/CDA1 family)
MNDRFFFNVFLVMFASLLYVTGILFLLMRLTVKKGIYVFNYHGFNTLDNDYWKFGSVFSSNYKKNFEKQLIFFNKHFKAVDSFDLENVVLDRPKYLLTFDDGYKDNYQVALPVLKKYATPAVFFITTGPTGTNQLLWFDRIRARYENTGRKKGWGAIRQKRELKKKLSAIKENDLEEEKESQKLDRTSLAGHGPLMMNWEEIIKAHGQGIQIGAHTNSHRILSSLDAEDQEEEITSSIDKIHKNIGHKPYFFAYPQGDRGTFDQDSIRMLKSAGIRYAFTTILGVNKNKISPYYLKRIGIKPSDPIPVTTLRIIRASLSEKSR